MAYVPGFQHDLFISYAHVDNLPRAAGEQGWVDLFEYTLRTALAQLLGRAEAFSIWRDAKLAGNDAFDEAIADRIRGSALFLPVLSPGYLASTYCLQELDQFATADDAGWSARLRAKRRLLKLEFSSVPQEPDALRSTTGRRFYAVDAASGHELRYRRTSESDADQRYWTAASDMAYDIATTLKLMRAALTAASISTSAPASTSATVTVTFAGSSSGSARPLFAVPTPVQPLTDSQPHQQATPQQQAQPQFQAQPQSPSQAASQSNGAAAPPIVYLAEVTDDLDDARNEVARALEQRGVLVRPAAPLPRDLAGFDARVRADLSGSALSLHLVGDLPGKALAGDPRSMSRLQYDLATETGGGSGNGPPRLVWVPPDLDREALKPGAQRDWLQALEEQTGANPAECLRVGLEELKETLMRRLFTIPAPQPANAGAPGSLIYISCEEQDDSEAVRIKEELKAARHDVILPARHGDPAALDRHHRTNVRNCDALMVLYVRASVFWVREQVVTARRVAPQIMMSVYDGPPADRQVSKEDLNLEFHNLVVLNCRTGFQPSALRQLLSRLDGPRPLLQ